MEEDVSVFNPTFECSYFIIVNHNGCVDTSDVFYYGASLARLTSITTSPNPTKDFLNVKFENEKNQYVELELVNSMGVKLDEFISNGSEMNIDLRDYPSGIYYIHFNSKDNVQGCVKQEVQKVSTKIILNK